MMRYKLVSLQLVNPTLKSSGRSRPGIYCLRSGPTTFNIHVDPEEVPVHNNSYTAAVQDGQIPQESVRICSEANMFFVLGRLLNIIKQLDEGEAICFIKGVVDALSYAKKELYIRWETPKILTTAIDSTILWLLNNGRTISFLDQISREQLIKHIRMVQQTTMMDRLNQQHDLIINFLKESQAHSKNENNHIGGYRILDIGIGACYPVMREAAITTRQLSERIKEQFPATIIYGVDRDLGPLGEVNLTAKNPESNIKYIQADAAKELPLSKQSVDAALVCNVDMHLDDPARIQMMTNVLSIVRHGGLLIWGHDEGGYIGITKSEDGNYYLLGSLRYLEMQSMSHGLLATIQLVLSTQSPIPSRKLIHG